VYELEFAPTDTVLGEWLPSQEPTQNHHNTFWLTTFSRGGLRLVGLAGMFGERVAPSVESRRIMNGGWSNCSSYRFDGFFCLSSRYSVGPNHTWSLDRYDYKFEKLSLIRKLRRFSKHGINIVFDFVNADWYNSVKGNLPHYRLAAY